MTKKATDPTFEIISSETRIQWNGAVDTFYDGSEGFPGIRVPLDLANKVEALRGMKLQVPMEKKLTAFAVEIRSSFKDDGIVLSTPSYTTWDNKWKPAKADSVAFQVLGPTGPYVETYWLSPYNVVTAWFWVAFKIS